MRLNLLFGGPAGGGINTVSEITSKILSEHGYYVFNYRDYPSLIRGGHNFNIVSFSDNIIASHESKLDVIVAMDDLSVELHKSKLKKDGIILNYKPFEDLGRDVNIALSAALASVFGIDKKIILDIVKKKFKTKEAIDACEKGYASQKNKFSLKKLKNKITLMSGSYAFAYGAANSGLDLYIAYPMTPATPLMRELASLQTTWKGKNKFTVFQAENEISVVNGALGASYSGANTMIGSSGGGFDLMGEGLSLQGMSEVPLVVYLAMRSGPGTGVPTYTSQADLNIALRTGHGDFPRAVIAPGDAVEAIKKTNEAIYLSQKFNSLSILVSDKHLAESQYSFTEKPLKNFLKPLVNRKIPGKTNSVVKASGYEHNNEGNTIEDPVLTIEGHDRRILRYYQMKKECERFEMFKVYGNKNSKNVVVSWGSNKGAILDAISGNENSEKLDCKFIHVIYVKPLSEKIKKEIVDKNIILIEANSTGQFGRVLKEKTGISVPKENRIFRYDGRPFLSDELAGEIKKRLRK
ncbi:2-oxoacid:acceptor oxidoreductase family protein [Candidatus Pacearchaeota archaeon]|nr:2-oxoacid:acceptor oxidoreductase family protein [Candidatus Pacearchaeota archaeon]